LHLTGRKIRDGEANSSEKLKKMRHRF